MEDVQKYYRQKANLGVQDEYLERITEKDIDMMQKSFGIIVMTPFLTAAVMYAAKGLKRDFSMNESFVYNVRRLQDNFMS